MTRTRKQMSRTLAKQALRIQKVLEEEKEEHQEQREHSGGMDHRRAELKASVKADLWDKRLPHSHRQNINVTTKLLRVILEEAD